MDKNTLSQYGWVVICIIVIAILLGLATPFGNFVKESVMNTTTSFGDKINASLNKEKIDEEKIEFEISNTSDPLLSYRNASCASIGDKIYVFGGENKTPLNTVRMFDPATNEMTTLSAKMPTALTTAGCATVGDKVYLFGGRTTKYGGSETNAITVFDTKTETFTTLETKIPTAATNISCVSVGNKIYLFGGIYYSTYYGYSLYLSSISVFNTVTETIETLDATLANPSSGHKCCLVGNNIYILGGAYFNRTSGTSGTYVYYDTIQVFNTLTNSITSKNTKMHSALSGMSCEVIGDKIYIFGGSSYTSKDCYTNAIVMYDTKTDEFTTLDVTLPLSVTQMASCAYNNKIYLFGGYDYWNPQNTISCFSFSK